MRPGLVVMLLTLLLGIQPITTDLHLPALPTLQPELGASIGAAQLTLPALIIAFGLAQLVPGPRANRFGQRPVLLGVPAFGLGLTLVAWTLVKRHGEPLPLCQVVDLPVPT